MSRGRLTARIATLTAVAALAAGLSTTAAAADERLAPFGSEGFVPISADGLAPFSGGGEGLAPFGGGGGGLAPFDGVQGFVPITAGGLVGADLAFR